MLRAIAICLPLGGCNSYDRGGITVNYLAENTRSWQQPQAPIPINCNSSCNVKLSGNYCIQPAGSFGVHASTYGSLTGPKVSVKDNLVRASVPACFRSIADNLNAWTKTNIIVIPAVAVISACPHLPVCGE